MKRRDFTKLLLLSPLALSLKPKPVSRPADYDLLCQFCSDPIGVTIKWPYRVGIHGTSVCATCGGGKSFMTHFMIVPYDTPEALAEIQRQQVEHDQNAELRRIVRQARRRRLKNQSLIV